MDELLVGETVDLIKGKLTIRSALGGFQMKTWISNLRGLEDQGGTLVLGARLSKATAPRVTPECVVLFTVRCEGDRRVVNFAVIQ